MRRRRHLQSVILAFWALTLPETGLARGGPPHKRVEKVLERLDLTEKQKAEIRSIHDSTKNQGRSLHEKMRAAKDALDDRMASAEATNVELRELHKAFIKAKNGMMEARLETMLKVRAVLTPEQRVQFHQLMAEGREKWRSKHQNHGSPPQ